MHFIRRDASATYKLKTRYRYFNRTNLIYQTNLIRFRRRAVVEFNCSWDLEIKFDDNATYKPGLRGLLDTSKDSLRYNVRFKGAKCSAVTKNKAIMFSL